MREVAIVLLIEAVGPRAELVGSTSSNFANQTLTVEAIFNEFSGQAVQQGSV